MLLKIQLRLNPKRLLSELRRYFHLRVKNENLKKLSLEKMAYIKDGSLNFGLLVYYIKPEEQIKQLHNFGFTDVQVFSRNGKRILDQEELIVHTDPWIYYLCRT